MSTNRNYKKRSRKYKAPKRIKRRRFEGVEESKITEALSNLGLDEVSEKVDIMDIEESMSKLGLEEKNPLSNLPKDITRLIFDYVDELLNDELKFNIQFNLPFDSLTDRRLILFLTRRFEDFDIKRFLVRSSLTKQIRIDTRMLKSYLKTKYDIIIDNVNKFNNHIFELRKTYRILYVEDTARNFRSQKWVNDDFDINMFDLDICYYDESFIYYSYFDDDEEKPRSIYLYLPNFKEVEKRTFPVFHLPGSGSDNPNIKVTVNFPNVTKIGDGFMEGMYVESVYIIAPHLKTIGDEFLSTQESLVYLRIDAPELESIGKNWVDWIDNNYYYDNRVTLVMNTPNLKEIGSGHALILKNEPYYWAVRYGGGFATSEPSDGAIELIPALTYESESLPWEKFRALL